MRSDTRALAFFDLATDFGSDVIRRLATARSRAIPGMPHRLLPQLGGDGRDQVTVWTIGGVEDGRLKSAMRYLTFPSISWAHKHTSTSRGCTLFFFFLIGLKLPQPASSTAPPQPSLSEQKVLVTDQEGLGELLGNTKMKFITEPSQKTIHVISLKNIP